ncbi:unnamed protein product [Nezara viridula]|uniref:Uncharacterized protein n=1 Tax=Nezara viridula TaxID=85310 RepID=A0A9P0MSI7_NEZVI|nr:unnamed protein product [Nezara viridula]
MSNYDFYHDYQYYLNDFNRRNAPQVEPDTPLREAIKTMNMDKVKELIQRDRSEINTHNSKGWTPLHEAAADDRRFFIFQYLLSAGADLDYKAENGVSPFYVACKYGSIKIAKLLIEAGCKINDKFAYDYDYNRSVRFGFTALHVACTRKNEQIIMLLLANGAQTNVVDDIGRAPIHYAIDNSNGMAVQMLIDAGADLHVKDIYGCTPLHYVSMLGNITVFNVMKFLYTRKKNLNRRTPEGLTPLMLACQFKHYHISEALIQLGADTSVADISGHLALHMAANGGYRLFKLLLKNTSSKAIEKHATHRPNSKAWRSLTCVVIESHYFECLELLFNSGLSEDVLKCPEKLNGHVVSPLGFLLLHNNRWFGKEHKLRWLELFLSYDFMVDPVYHNNENIIPSKLKCQMWKVSIDKIMEPSSRRIGSIEAVVQMHSRLHIDCYCEMFLSMILSKIASPDKFLPSDSLRQICLFNESAREGFLAALSLLKYSEYVDPDDVIDTLLKQMANPNYRWMGHEDGVVRLLVEKCATNFLPVFSGIKNALPEPGNPDDVMKYESYVRMEEMFKSNNRVLSLKRLSRFAVRKHIRKEAENSDVCFRSYLKQIILPFPLSKYVLYDDYF